LDNNLFNTVKSNKIEFNDPFKTDKEEVEKNDEDN